MKLKTFSPTVISQHKLQPKPAQAPQPPTSDPVQEAVDRLPVLSKVALATGDALAKLGGGGCALAGGALGFAATLTPAGSGLGIVPVAAGAIFGYLEGWDAAGAQKAWDGGPSSADWQRRAKSDVRPPRSLTTAGAGSHFLTAAAFLGGMAAGTAAFGTSSPIGLLTGVGAAAISAVVMGSAAGKAEQALLWAKYPEQAEAMGWYRPD